MLSPCWRIANAANRRHLPAIGRFLIVVTFIEDALRIITQWNDQLSYLSDYRHSAPPPSTAAELEEALVLVLAAKSTTLTFVAVWHSSMGLDPSLPGAERDCDADGVGAGDRPAAFGVRGRRTFRGGYNASTRIRSHFRPQLLPPQPFSPRRAADGVVGLVPPQEIRVRWSPPDRREGQKGLLPARWSRAAGVPVHRLRLLGRVDHFSHPR
jgi:hypothetical protein